MFSKDFVLLVFIACVVATPVAYYCAHNWLKNFAYRTDMPWWLFFTACLGALVITLVTISFQAIQAAIANPVKSLRA
jgi:uncharacterized membrane protein YdcZ (DUF606 family)